jgi:hypothetical protein
MMRRENARLVEQNVKLQEKPRPGPDDVPQLEDMGLRDATHEEILIKYRAVLARVQREAQTREGLERRLAAAQAELKGTDGAQTEEVKRSLHQLREARALCESKMAVLREDEAALAPYEQQALAQDREINQLEAAVADVLRNGPTTGAAAGDPLDDGGKRLLRAQVQAFSEENARLADQLRRRHHQQQQQQQQGYLSGGAPANLPPAIEMLLRSLENERAKEAQLTRALASLPSPGAPAASPYAAIAGRPAALATADPSLRARIQEAEILLDALREEIAERREAIEREARQLEAQLSTKALY